MTGAEQIEQLQVIDRTPLPRSARSNPLTCLGLFHELRLQFAQLGEARARQYGPGHFSLNVAGGRCPTCEGLGQLIVDMQFLPDVSLTCPDCRGCRYQRETLEIKFRGLNIAEILELSAEEAFAFFRGLPRLQKRLKALRDVGLGYLSLGRAVSTLSGGEIQALRLAMSLIQGHRKRTLFVMEEPTLGLHPADICRLMDVCESLIAFGHSLVVIEHHPDFIRQADFIIDLGPGAGSEGGRIVVSGTPEEVAAHPESLTGQALRRD